MKRSHEIWKDLLYPINAELLRSKHAAIAQLSNSDSNVRMTAINLCDLHWNCSADPDFVAACLRMADSDPDESVRLHAIGSLGKALQSTRDPVASRMLARIVADSGISQTLRYEAYWALRAVQLGLTEEDAIRRSARLAKQLLSKRQARTLAEAEFKRALLCGGRFDESTWDNAETIDWAFVDKHVGDQR